jgi:hypothetical protein
MIAPSHCGEIPDTANNGVRYRLSLCPSGRGFWLYSSLTHEWLPVPTQWLSRMERDALIHMLQVQNQEEDYADTFKSIREEP